MPNYSLLFDIYALSVSEFIANYRELWAFTEQEKEMGKKQTKTQHNLEEASIIQSANVCSFLFFFFFFSFL